MVNLLHKVSVNDCFLVKSGGNQHGHGKQVAVVKRISKKGNVYCDKYRMKPVKCVAKNYKLEPDNIISAFAKFRHKLPLHPAQ